jgi:hypothetical protein
MPLLETKGAGSAQGFGLTVGGSEEPVYIEDVFSTYLYTGTGGADLTVTNGIDLATKGGIVWKKQRNGVADHLIYQAPGVGDSWLVPNSTAALATGADYIDFSTTGFVDRSGDSASNTYVTWTFRKQKKFFDVVTYTGDGSASPRQIAHSLGSVPGFIVIKRTDTTSDWTVWHRSVTGNAFLQTNDAWQAGYTRITTPDSTTFTVGTSIMVNASGGTYVAYLFAHNAGGFGLAGTDNVISCGSFTTGSNGKMSAPVNLGYEAQWLLAKNINSAENWVLYDTMRGMNNTEYAALNPNSSGAEYTGTSAISATATGFDTPTANGPFANSTTYIYIAIRRGPMKVPTVGTSVFSPVVYTGNGGTQTITSNFPVDFTITDNRPKNSAAATDFKNRLRGSDRHLGSQYNYQEQTEISGLISFDRNTSVGMGVGPRTNDSGVSYVTRMFRRAPSFFDEVCYTGTGVARTVTHNLTVVPELMIVKTRVGTVDDWGVYTTATGNTGSLRLNTSAAFNVQSVVWNNTSPTSSVFTVGTNSMTNANTVTYVAYLFATAPGVSKVGSYTGTGTTLQINCGFTGGARFVMIKRTDDTGDWYVWDTARGIIAGNDPYLLFNSTAAEVTNTDYVDTYSAGFEISSTAPAAINASGGSFIFLAIA